MIAFFALFLFLLTFIAGYLMNAHPLLGLILVGATAISAGCLTAFLQSSRLPEYDDSDDDSEVFGSWSQR